MFSMQQERLTVAVWRYDRTQALYDGRVTLKDRELTLIDAPLEEIFSRALGNAEFHVSELSFSNFLRLTVAGKCAYSGVPVFPSRSFRHGAFYVRKAANIRRPEDLIGKKVGVREYSMTAALAARGALRDQFGVRSDQIHWVMGDVDEKERDRIELPVLYRPISIECAPGGALLSEMLVNGELDALLAYKPIAPYKAGDARVARLFQDPAEVEERYFTDTGIFPIMHLVGVRRDVAEADPEIPMAVYRAFTEAQGIADADLHLEQALKIGLPWLTRELKRTITVMGENYWPSGFKANRAVVKRMIDWSFEDGLIPRRAEPEELFFGQLLET
jgi:4,5-dihydroxyphthalate decarboxylase